MKKFHSLVVMAALSAVTTTHPACAFAQAVSSPVTWTAQTAPFVVIDSQGGRIPEPFLGGFDVPRPQLVDIDGDGDLDLFVQERSAELSFFERDSGKWHWRSDRYQDLDIAEWYRFVDLDEDGLVDLLAESRYSYITAYLNRGTATSPRFELVADSLMDADGKPLFADRQNILQVVDIDCNGRLDMFIGRVEGTIDHYEATAERDALGMPRFRLLDQNWMDILIIGGQPGGPPLPDTRPTMHGANTMAFTDIDNDGDLDLLWGDFFEPGLLLFENTGSCQYPSLRGPPQQFPRDTPLITTGYNAPAPGDIDGDGDTDLIVGVIGGAFSAARSGSENLYLLEQRGPGDWEVITSRTIATIDLGSETIPTLVDYDGDGDIDLLVGNRIDPHNDVTASITWLENTGTESAPALRDRGSIGIAGEFHYAPALVDLDSDGRLDLVAGTWRDRLQWFTNTGTTQAPVWQMRDSALVTITRGSNTVPALADFDRDGDLDMVIGEASGQLNLYRNDGTADSPDFVLVSDEFQDIDVGRRSIPTAVDFDGDGKPDLVIGSESGELQFWLNVSSGDSIAFEIDVKRTIKGDSYIAPALADLDGDGQLELLLGGASGGLRYYR